MHKGIMVACGDDELLYNALVHVVSGGFKGLKDVRKITTEDWRLNFEKTLRGKPLEAWAKEAETKLSEGGKLPF